MPTHVWVIWSLLILPVVVSFIRQRDAWPFSCFPMFSRGLKPEDVEIVRIAIEDGEGRITWWQPAFFRLPDSFGDRFRALWHGGLESPAGAPDVLAMAARIRQLILMDRSHPTGPAAVLFVVRRIATTDDGFAAHDEVGARVAFGHPHDERRASS